MSGDGNQHELTMTPLPDGKNWKLLKPYRRHICNGFEVNIPAGFITDLASVPRLFWRIFPPYGKYTKAAIVHDYLYRTSEIMVTRKQADRYMVLLMKEDNVPFLSRWTMYISLRIFAKFAWKRR
jgi:hypothetical protein